MLSRLLYSRTGHETDVSDLADDVHNNKRSPMVPFAACPTPVGEVDIRMRYASVEYFHVFFYVFQLEHWKWK
jgi:hypothetical protein